MAEHYDYPMAPITKFRETDIPSSSNEYPQDPAYISYPDSPHQYTAIQASGHSPPSRPGMTPSSSTHSFSTYISDNDDTVPLNAGHRPGSYSISEDPRNMSRASQVLYSTSLMPEDNSIYTSGGQRYSPAFEKRPPKKRKLLCIVIVVTTALIILLVVLPIYFVYIRTSDSKSQSVGSKSGKGPTSGAPIASSDSPSSDTGSSILTSGGDGSTVTLADGKTFTYKNSFGGTWDADPYSLKAQAQSWTTSLDSEWDFGQTRIFGVNLGGWLVTEPFIVPSLYEEAKMPDGSIPVDEWNLMIALGSNAQKIMDRHYSTFITEEDFAQIAAAGLNWIRLPIPFWMVETMPNEPFYTGGCFPHLINALIWARKYGLRVNLDLHSVSGSQNGWNHSGRVGGINFLKGLDGVFNAERTLEVIRTVMQFVMQEEYRDVVKMFSILNEPRAYEMGQDSLMAWYLQAHDVIRSVTGIGHGPLIVISDGLLVPAVWASAQFQGFDRMVLDSHLYIAFEERIVADLPNTISYPCTGWASLVNSSFASFGMNTGGEASIAINDCGKWLNGVTGGSVFDGSDKPDWIPNDKCDLWTDSSLWTVDMKTNFQTLALTTFDSLQNFFYWTWKTGISTETNATINPMWNYKHGLQLGYVPLDPRNSIGICQNQFSETAAKPEPHSQLVFQAGIIPDTIRTLNPWPPISIGPPSSSIKAVFLPTMTRTGTPHTLIWTSPTAAPGIKATMSPQNGWANPTDTTPAYVPVEGCAMSDLWGDPVDKPLPTAACTGS